MGKAGSIAALRPTVPTTAAKTFFGTNFGQFPAFFGTTFGVWYEIRAVKDITVKAKVDDADM